MKFHRLGLALLFALSCENAVRAEVGVKLHSVPGQPWKVVFPDGREAGAYFDARDPLVIQIPFQVTDNTCTDKIGMRGKFTTGFAVARFGLNWDKHPTKKGSPVVFKTISTNEEVGIFSFVFVSAAEEKNLPLMARKLPPQELVGNDYSWLPGGGSKAPEAAYLSRWDIEAMVLNLETGLTENRTIGLSQGVSFKLQDSGNLRITNIKRYLTGIFSFFQGDIWSMVSRGKDGGACLISVKADLLSVTNALNAYFTAPVTLAPYPFGLDEFSTTATPLIFRQFIEKPQDYNAQ